NARRFGLWDAHVNWQDIFRAPNAYLEGLYTDEEIEETFVYEMPDRLKALFRIEELEPFSMKDAYVDATRKGKRPKEAIEISLKNHVHMIKRVAEDEFHAIELIDELEGDIEQRIRDYTKCISKTTDNYRQWLIDEYNRKLRQGLRVAFED
ncbi:MAG: DEAD/DEAH box helicase, partial [Flavobacteriales bacterium]